MRPADALKEKMAEFKAAVYGLPCASCGKYPPSWGHRAHHVVYRQHLPVEQEWNPANALPLCDEPFGNCHQRHHSAAKKVSVDKLTEENLAFAKEVLGDAAPYYFERRYEGSNDA